MGWQSKWCKQGHSQRAPDQNLILNWPEVCGMPAAQGATRKVDKEDAAQARTQGLDFGLEGTAKSQEESDRTASISQIHHTACWRFWKGSEVIWQPSGQT